VGTYRLSRNTGRLTLIPLQDPVAASDGSSAVGKLQTPYERAAGAVASILHSATKFTGTADASDGNESPLEIEIHWEDRTQRAVGKVTFLNIDRQIAVDGFIIPDKASPGEVILKLGNGGYDDNSEYQLKLLSFTKPGFKGRYRVGNQTGTFAVQPAEHQN
jgi:hypothetical protein